MFRPNKNNAYNNVLIFSLFKKNIASGPRAIYTNKNLKNQNIKAMFIYSLTLRFKIDIYYLDRYKFNKYCYRTMPLCELKEI